MSYRFTDKPERTSINITGRYHVVFAGEDEESKNAVGVFKQEGNHLTATFLTTTGDYRFLEGEIGGNRIWLSAFDGSHLFLFTALVHGDSLYNGEFFSGKHWHDTWNGVKDENAHLISPDSLTTLRSGQSKINFKFPDENGKLISLTDKKYKNKAVIIQIMGSWCPNCMDETKFLVEWYRQNRKNKSRIEIIALDFEKIADTTHAFHNIRRLKKQFGVSYSVLFAGPSDKKEAAKSLPMLNRIFAYPTLLFLNKEKKVVKTHTGFNGPATGEEYSTFIKQFEQSTKIITK
jgi:thiol-disulfide isomerase/thioredoxin